MMKPSLCDLLLSYSSLLSTFKTIATSYAVPFGWTFKQLYDIHILGNHKTVKEVHTISKKWDKYKK